MTDAKIIKNTLPAWYGGYTIEKVETGDDLILLTSELKESKSGFNHNLAKIFEAYKAGKLYGIRIAETDEMFRKRSRGDKIFARDGENLGSYLLPAFCIINKEKETVECVIIWVHQRARGVGIATEFIKNLGINKISTALKESVEFWKNKGLIPDRIM